MGKHVRRGAFVLVACVCVFTGTTARAATCEGDDPRDVCIPRDIFFMPGVHALAYAPRGSSEPYFGAGVQLAPFQWSHNNDRFGPSQGTFFVQASLLESTASDSTLALYELGFSLSLERNSSRNFLIPFFGTSLGALVNSARDDIGAAHAFLGLHLCWHQNLVVNLEGGYQFPFDDVDEWRGPRAQASVRFSMW